MCTAQRIGIAHSRRIYEYSPVTNVAFGFRWNESTDHDEQCRRFEEASEMCGIAFLEVRSSCCIFILYV